MFSQPILDFKNLIIPPNKLNLSLLKSKEIVTSQTSIVHEILMKVSFWKKLEFLNIEHPKYLSTNEEFDSEFSNLEELMEQISKIKIDSKNSSENEPPSNFSKEIIIYFKDINLRFSPNQTTKIERIKEILESNLNIFIKKFHSSFHIETKEIICGSLIYCCTIEGDVGRISVAEIFDKMLKLTNNSDVFVYLDSPEFIDEIYPKVLLIDNCGMKGLIQLEILKNLLTSLNEIFGSEQLFPFHFLFIIGGGIASVIAVGLECGIDPTTLRDTLTRIEVALEVSLGNYEMFKEKVRKLLLSAFNDCKFKEYSGFILLKKTSKSWPDESHHVQYQPPIDQIVEILMDELFEHHLTLDSFIQQDSSNSNLELLDSTVTKRDFTDYFLLSIGGGQEEESKFGILPGIENYFPDELCDWQAADEDWQLVEEDWKENEPSHRMTREAIYHYCNFLRISFRLDPSIPSFGLSKEQIYFLLDYDTDDQIRNIRTSRLPYHKDDWPEQEIIITNFYKAIAEVIVHLKDYRFDREDGTMIFPTFEEQSKEQEEEELTNYQRFQQYQQEELKRQERVEINLEHEEQEAKYLKGAEKEEEEEGKEEK